jgi:AcrR family transcriptional regulator
LNDQQTGQPATRARIVEAARQLFFEQGYHATGMAQILKTAGARSGSLYHFFPSKEELLVAVLERYKELLHPAVLHPAYARTTDPIERVFAVLDGYRRLLEATDFELGCPIGNVAIENSNTHPAVRRLVTENFEAWAAAVAQSISEAGSRLPRDIDPVRLGRHVLAVMEGAVMLARAYRSFEPFDDAVRQLRDYFGRLSADSRREGVSQ